MLLKCFLVYQNNLTGQEVYYERLYQGSAVGIKSACMNA